jgi:hypothetical protein
MASKTQAVQTQPATLKPVTTDFKFQHVNIQRTLAALEQASGGRLSIFNLEQWRVPSGANDRWRIAGKSIDAFEGVVLHHRETKSYWKGAFKPGETGPPDCQSADGLTGVGDPGGSCQQCPLNFNGCKNFYRLLILPADAALPIHLQVPGGSIKSVQEYMLGLARQHGLFTYDVLTRFSLKVNEENPDMPFAYVVCEPVGLLPTEILEKMEAYAEHIRQHVHFPQPAPALAAGGQPPRQLFSDVDDDDDDDIDDPPVPGGAVG